MATREEMQKIAKEAVETYIKTSEGDVTKGRITETELLEELNTHIKSVEKTIIGQAAQNIKDSTKRDKLIEKLQSSVFKKLEDQGVIEKEKKPGFWERGSKELDWNLDRRINGLNNILSGNFKYGSLQVLQSFQKGRALIGHPMIQWVAAAAKLGIALNDFIWKANDLSRRVSGSPLSIEATKRKWQMSYEDFAMTAAYGQKKEDLYNYKIENFGKLTKEQLSKDPRFSGVWAQGRFALQQYGASPDLMNTLLKQQNTIGRSTSSMEKFNYKLIKSLEGLDKLSSQQFLQNLTELNKVLLANNINGLASAESFKRFQDQLNRGTLTYNDFIQGLTTRRKSSTATLAGIGMMMAQRGLGGKALQAAAETGEASEIAHVVRAGGNEIQMGLEQLTVSLAKETGLSNLEEALAAISDSEFGQLVGDLKNLEVQRTLARGGTLAIKTEGKELELNQLAKDVQGRQITEQEDFREIDRKLLTNAVETKGLIQNIYDYLKLSALESLKDVEKNRPIEVKINMVSPTIQS